MKESGIDYQYHITKSLHDAYKVSKEANTKNFDAIIAVGGDGTINAVLNGFYNDKGYRISSSKFGIIYTGTSPDFCKSYHIPLKLEQAVKDIISCKTIKIRIARIMLSSEASGKISQTRFFACCANVGLGAELARRANSGMRKYFGDFLGTFISLILTLVKFKSNDFTLRIDGENKTIKNGINLSLGLTKYIASGIKVNFDTQNHKDQFYLMTAQNLTFSRIIPLLKKVYSGKSFKNTDYLSLSYCKQIEIFSNDQNPEVEFDGDPAGFLPCTIELAKEALDLITSKPV